MPISIGCLLQMQPTAGQLKRSPQWVDPDVQARYDEQFIPAFRANGLRDPEGYRLLLTHVGARSGNPRTTGLAYYDLGERTIVVAGNGGERRGTEAPGLVSQCGRQPTGGRRAGR